MRTILIIAALTVAGCGGGASSPSPSEDPTISVSSSAPDAATAGPVELPAGGPVVRPVEPGTYHIPPSAWSDASFQVTLPEGWEAQYGGFIKHSDQPEELVFSPFVVDAIYTDACEGEGVLMDVGPSVDDLSGALLQQPGPKAGGPVDTTLGGHPTKRIDLMVPEGMDLKSCRLEGIGLQVWYSSSEKKYFVLLPDGTASVYVLDVDGQRQVFLTQHRSATSDEDLAELQAILASIQFKP